MTSHRRGGLKKKKHAILADSSESKDKFEDLLVFGYACKLFRDDDKALQIDQGQLLIPWMGDDAVKIDRYDARGTLSDLKPFEAPQGGYDRFDGMTAEEKRLEKLLDEERYYAMYKNEEEEATIKEEEVKRLQQDIQQVTTLEVSYHQVPFSYSNQSTGDGQPRPGNETSTAQKSIQGDLGDAIYVPPPELDVPGGTVVPPTQKLARIILKTAAFISTQGTQMEIVVKAKQANNAMFQFLHFDCVLHPFYRHVLSAIRNGSYTVSAEDEEGPTSATPSTANGVKSPAEEAASDGEDSDDDNYLHPSLQPKAVVAACDSGDPSADPPDAVRSIVDKTASYMARNGRHLESVVLSKGDVRFLFLGSDHAHHAYYERKLALYVDLWAAVKSETAAKSPAPVEPTDPAVGLPRAQQQPDDPRHNAASDNDHEGQDRQELKNERRRKAAVFLNKLRQGSSRVCL
nr:EOG090X07RL [Sida crystallina]